MRTAGAVFVSLVIMVVLNFLYGFATGFLSSAIYGSTGIVWLPAVLTCAMVGAAAYGGLAAGLAIFKSANVKIAFGIVVAIMTLITISSEYDLINRGHGILAIIFFAINYLAVVLGCFIAMKTARSEET